MKVIEVVCPNCGATQTGEIPSRVFFYYECWKCGKACMMVRRIRYEEETGRY